MQKEVYLIKEAAKAVQVESHVLRYWEEELGMMIQRNEKGHRVYTREDVERFQKVKELKEEGLQLKAVKKILQESGMKCISFKVRNIEDYVKMNTPDKVSQIVKEKLNAVEESPDEVVDEGEQNNEDVLDQLWKTNDMNVKKNEIQFIPKMKLSVKDLKEDPAESSARQDAALRSDYDENQQQKMMRMQTLIKKFITDTVTETHERIRDTIKEDIRENVAKEIDYQFRCREDKEEEEKKLRQEKEDQRMAALQEQSEKWELDRKKREEEHYKNIDELLRKSLKERHFIKKEEVDKKNKEKGLHEKLFSDKRKKLSNN